MAETFLATDFGGGEPAERAAYLANLKKHVLEIDEANHK
jgi:hypothetical protein